MNMTVPRRPTDSVFVYDVTSDSWMTGPPLPRAIEDCQATTTSNGEIFVTGFAEEYDDDDDADSEDSSREPREAKLCFAYRNGAWVEVADLRTDPTGRSPREEYPSWQSLLLG